MKMMGTFIITSGDLAGTPVTYHEPVDTVDHGNGAFTTFVTCPEIVTVVDFDGRSLDIPTGDEFVAIDHVRSMTDAEWAEWQALTA